MCCMGRGGNRRRKFVVTTVSNHGRTVYPNLAAELVTTGLNQLWIADITYIHLRLVSLAAAAGCVDAASFLGLDQVFTANQTGNTVRDLAYPIQALSLSERGTEICPSHDEPWWVHLVWIPVGLALTLGGLRVAKAFLVAQEYAHRAREGRILP